MQVELTIPTSLKEITLGQYQKYLEIAEKNENKENKPIKVVFQLGPDKKNEYNLYQFKRLEF